jgi:hypothetical protein
MICLAALTDMLRRVTLVRAAIEVQRRAAWSLEAVVRAVVTNIDLCVLLPFAFLLTIQMRI